MPSRVLQITRCQNDHTRVMMSFCKWQRYVICKAMYLTSWCMCHLSCIALFADTNGNSLLPENLTPYIHPSLEVLELLPQYLEKSTQKQLRQNKETVLGMEKMWERNFALSWFDMSRWQWEALESLLYLITVVAFLESLRCLFPYLTCLKGLVYSRLPRISL